MPKTYTAAGTVSAGDVYTAAAHNIIATDVNNLIVPPAVRCIRSTDLSYTLGAAIAFDGEDYDTDDMHSTATNTSRITIQTAGIYLVTAHIYTTFTGTLTGMDFWIAKNTAKVAEQFELAMSQGINWNGTIQVVTSAVATDYFEVAFNVTGSNTHIVKASVPQSYFSATWIGRTS
jgi:hypothetical protein